MKKVSKAVAMPTISKQQAPAIFEKLVRHADTYDHAWGFVRKAFPRKQWGRVREIVQKLSKFKTLRSAFDALHAKGSKKSAKHGAKSEQQSRAA